MKMMQKFGILTIALMALLVWNAPAMAATTYTTPEAAEANIYQSRDATTGTVTVSYEAPTLIINDVIQMVKVPRDSTVTDVILVTDDLDDGGTSLTLSVGTGANDDYFIVANTVGQAGGLVRASAATAFPLALSANDTIDVKVIAAAGTSVTGTINLTVTYHGSP